jgi:hypothetical protein
MSVNSQKLQNSVVYDRCIHLKVTFEINPHDHHSLPNNQLYYNNQLAQ